MDKITTRHININQIKTCIYEGRITIPLTGLCPSDACPVPSQDRQRHVSWSFLYSLNRGERWMFAEMILVEMLTSLVYLTFFSLFIVSPYFSGCRYYFENLSIWYILSKDKMTELLTLFTCLYICKLDHKVIKYDLTMINVLIEINHQYSTTHILCWIYYI